MMGNRYVVEKDTKSLAGERELPLPAPVLAALRSFKVLQAKDSWPWVRHSQRPATSWCTRPEQPSRSSSSVDA